MVDGVLLIDKPDGPTSHDVVEQVRRIVGQKRVGHTGTLDPTATGLLIICLGRATRLAPFAQGLEKEYRATFRLGAETETHDRTGRVVWRYNGSPPSTETVRRAVAAFVGPQLQMPPRFSAKKVAGVPAHRRSRRGESFLLSPREVEVSAFEVAHFDYPELVLRVVVSSGTYVRGLARDLGRRLNCGAYVEALRRGRIGPHRVEEARTLEELDADWRSVVRGMEVAVSHLPRAQVNEDQADPLMHGRPVERDGESPGWVQLWVGDRFFGVGRQIDGHLYPKRIVRGVR